MIEAISMKIDSSFMQIFSLSSQRLPLPGTPAGAQLRKNASKSVFDWYSNKMDVFEEAIPASMFLYQSKHMYNGGDYAIGADWMKRRKSFSFRLMEWKPERVNSSSA